MSGLVAHIRRRIPIGDLALIFLLGLTPLLWFREGKLLLSEDLMVPPNWEEFTQFWYIWNDQLGTGAQKILDSGRFPTLFIAAALQGLGVGLVQAQMAQFVFWFMLPGFSMYYLMAGLYHGEHRRLARMAAVLFYMFNLWLISNWLGYKEPLIAAVAILPFLLGIWIRTFAADREYLWAVLVSGLVSLAASPIGNNSSEMLAALLPLTLLFVGAALASARSRRMATLLRVTWAGLALGALTFALHAFWIVPEFAGVRSTLAAADILEFQRISSQFLEGQSLYTSVTNNVRFVSDWTWYQGLVDPYRTFVAGFLGSRILTSLGWLIFGVVVLGAVLGRGRQKGVFIALTAIGLVLGAGLNSPVGPLYAWVVDNVPLLWIVRSPWFKFTLLTVLGYSVLLGLATPFLVRLAKFTLTRIVGVWSEPVARRGALVCTFAVFLAIGPVYAYPFTLGLAFATPAERTFLNPNHVEPPDYVYQAADWLNNQPGDFRIMTIPGDAPWLSDWGYGGFGSFLQSLTARPVVFKRTPQSVKVSQGAPDLSGELVDQIDADLLDERSEQVSSLLSRLGIKYLVHERDVRYDFYSSFGFRVSDSPENVQRILEEAPGITLVETFGQWDIYEISDPRPRLEIASSMVAVVGLDARLMSRLATSLDSHTTVYVAPEDVPPGADRLITATAASGLLSSRSPGIPHIALADTASMTDAARVPIFGISTSYGDPEAWGEFEDLNPGETWRWFTLNNGDHYFITSESVNPAPAELSLDVLSYARQRSLFVYLNSELLSVTDVLPDTPTTIHIPNIQISPGENVISFYTPYPSDQRGDQNLAFAIRQDPNISRASYTWRPAVPEGPYRLQVTFRPFGDVAWPADRPNPLVIRVDGLPVSLSPEDGSVSRFSTQVQLDESSTIALRQLGQEEYFLQLTPSGERSDVPSTGVATPLQASPTSYRVLVDCDSPCVLIFNESFHSDWVASIDGRPLPHFEVDDYANAYLIGEPGTHVVDIEFLPQQWFRLAALVSATTTVIAISLLVASGRRGRNGSQTQAL